MSKGLRFSYSSLGRMFSAAAIDVTARKRGDERNYKFASNAAEFLDTFSEELATYLKKPHGIVPINPVHDWDPLVEIGFHRIVDKYHPDPSSIKTLYDLVEGLEQIFAQRAEELRTLREKNPKDPSLIRLQRFCSDISSMAIGLTTQEQRLRTPYRRVA